MRKTRGSCLCGAVVFEVQGEFDAFYLCHCRHCQKDSGSAHSANLFSANATLIWQAGADLRQSFRFPGTRHIHSFCSQCGSALPTPAGEETPLKVPAGSLDDPIENLPQAHLFDISRANWDHSLEALPAFPRLPLK